MSSRTRLRCRADVIAYSRFVVAFYVKVASNDDVVRHHVVRAFNRAPSFIVVSNDDVVRRRRHAVNRALISELRRRHRPYIPSFVVVDVASNL
ncbi:hypothetical protein MA16_Dca015837 [Dendrobium catenatum]|uniref:Uncharacterized protein n=1 Tax=Dendrobium catenatum TaxID=906689 RepID=A0A2I0X0I9_9ASPA|nr:hypothetical protein MA16_Dca015837 [Dendrobium catenatum]